MTGLRTLFCIVIKGHLLNIGVTLPPLNTEWGDSISVSVTKDHRLVSHSCSYLWIWVLFTVNICSEEESFLLTAVQKLQSHVCSCWLAVDGCSLRHSLQKTSGPSRESRAMGVPGGESLASELRVGLLLAMLGHGAGVEEKQEEVKLSSSFC